MGLLKITNIKTGDVLESNYQELWHLDERTGEERLVKLQIDDGFLNGSWVGPDVIADIEAKLKQSSYTVEVINERPRDTEDSP